MDLYSVFAALIGTAPEGCEQIAFILVGLTAYHLFDVLIDLFRSGGKWF